MTTRFIRRHFQSIARGRAALEIKTPALRDRRLEKLWLKNGLNAVVISDPGATAASAALSCEIGSWNDGKYAGTAHFLEHMLFLGVKKYPDPSDYERFIFDNGGSLNGWTANDHSLYYFSGLNPSQLRGGIDRFSRFFYEPLFDPSCVDRERNAVHEEYKKNIESDGWRLLHVKKELAAKSHPIAQFNTGNLDTMCFSREYLIDWYRQHYSANLMKLVVYGKESCAELASLVEDSFSGIPVLPDSKKPAAHQNIWDAHRGQVVWMDPIKDIRELSITWEIPIQLTNIYSKPDILLSSLLGHEGKNSILSLLKDRGLAEGLSCGSAHLGWTNATFSISVSLTQKGLASWRDVVSLVLGSLESFSKTPFPRYLFEERNSMRRVGYEFQQRSNSIATSYCEALRKEPLDSFPYNSLLIQDFREDEIRDLLLLLRPEAACIYIVGKGAPVSLDRTEKWMCARYTTFPLALDAVPPTTSVATPQRNHFIPQSLEIIKHQDADTPSLVTADQGIHHYHYTETQFGVPESFMKFAIKSAAIRPDDAKSIVLANLYSRFVYEDLNEVAYDASAAGLHYEISIDRNNSIAASVHGYSEKSLALLETVLRSMADPRLTREKFEVFKNSLLQRYQNASKNSPVQQAYEMLSHHLLTHHCHSKDLALAAAQVTFEELLAFSAVWFGQRRIEAFTGGNMSTAAGKEALDMVVRYLPGSECPANQIVLSGYSPPASPRLLTKELQLGVGGNALVWSVYAGEKNDQRRSEWSILTKLMQEPFYSELRTKQQTGYVVQSSGMQLRRHLFVNAAIQSNVYDPRDLLSRVELFQERFLAELLLPETLPRFEKIRQAELDRLNNPFDNLAGKLDFYNHLTYQEDQDYELLQRRKQVLGAMQLEQVQ
ncbi:hypothetical protein HDU91_006018, partial [Kappamyces sp. JEL0680]